MLRLQKVETIICGVLRYDRVFSHILVGIMHIIVSHWCRIYNSYSGVTNQVSLEYIPPRDMIYYYLKMATPIPIYWELNPWDLYRYYIGCQWVFLPQYSRRCFEKDPIFCESAASVPLLKVLSDVEGGPRLSFHYWDISKGCTVESSQHFSIIFSWVFSTSSRN
jgi:hypothetical protein